MAFKAPSAFLTTVANSALYEAFRTNWTRTVYASQFGFRMVARYWHIDFQSKMTKPKSGYSSNIIAAIACIIILLGIIDTIKFWGPFWGVKDFEALARELDPMKQKALQVQEQVPIEKP